MRDRVVDFDGFFKSFEFGNEEDGGEDFFFLVGVVFFWLDDSRLYLVIFFDFFVYIINLVWLLSKDFIVVGCYSLKCCFVFFYGCFVVKRIDKGRCLKRVINY